MTGKMKAARVMKQDERYTITDVDIPKPGKDEVLLKIKAAGFCHTDMMVAEGAFGSSFPITGSHEPAGIIEELGEGVEGWEKGDRVTALNHAKDCGICWDCKNVSAEELVCPDGKFTGLHYDGPFSEYYVARADRLAKIPDGMSFETAAPLSCAGVTIYGAIRKANLPKGSVLAISGLGALGHIGVQIAKAMGYFVVGIDARKGPIDLCNSFKLSPDLTINAKETKVEDAVKIVDEAALKAGLSDNRGTGVDAIIVTSEGKSAINYALSITKKHGTFVLVSQPEIVEIPFKDIIFRDIRIVGSLQGGQKVLQECVDLCANEGVVVKTTGWELGDINKMWGKQLDEDMVGKNVILFK